MPGRSSSPAGGLAPAGSHCQPPLPSPQNPMGPPNVPGNLSLFGSTALGVLLSGVCHNDDAGFMLRNLHQPTDH
ncbi:uncharacterized protein EI90DRAFT_3085681 [Cantharellus anzutake]|uniref:uncharacterized protein n=1 Tax=Cantharellus anzutake TaxID=1750568 RepID=UPI0019030409|nr:uncharacterized protein EI90DRAFT_3085681 [Cantharellus anzutake]KAF8317013.1 hypothetical protein EI90DRAFT_3085681 [Cantharellus anzutake]